MTPSENDPLPRTVVTGGAAETASRTQLPARGSWHGRRITVRARCDQRERPPVAAEASQPVQPRFCRRGRPEPGLDRRSSLHHIVIVGGGAAGLELATKLGDSLGRHKRAQITLVERARTHIWKPHLHEVAAGTMDVGRDAVDYLAQAADHYFRYRIGEMIGLDRARREVHLAGSYDAEGEEITPARAVPYDTLVMAVGSTSNDSARPEPRTSRSRSIPRRGGPVSSAAREPLHPGACAARPGAAGQLHVTIIGAGATGTELAAELHRTTRQVVAYGLDRIDPEKDLKITLVEAAERILPAVPPRVAEGRRGF